MCTFCCVQAWEYFLLRPKWVQWLQFRSTAKHKCAVQKLRNAIEGLIELAVPLHQPSSFMADLMDQRTKGVATEVGKRWLTGFQIAMKILPH